MNLLFDCHTFDAGPQGTTTFLAGLLNALPAAAAARERALSLTCAAHDAASVARFVRVPHDYAPISGGFLARNARAMPRLASDRFDAVVSQYVRPFRSRAATVSVIHDVLFLDYPALFGWRYRVIRRVLFGWAARHSDVVVTVSDYSRDRIAHHFGIPRQRIDVLPNAVEVDAPPRADAARRDDAPLRLLYVSRFEMRKRQHWCVAAARALAARGRRVELTLVGHAGGAYADAVRAQIAAGPAAGADIAIRSDLSDAALQRLYADTDLFLFPSACEGFGIPVIEAAAHGVPCVVSADTALEELAPHFAGPSVTGDDESAFVAVVAAAVERLAVLREEAHAIAPRTRATFRWSAVADDFLSILDRRGIIA